MRMFFTLAAIVFISGCADPIASAKEAVKAQATNKREISYRNLEEFPGNIVCGEYNEVTRWGEGADFQRFITRDDLVDATPSEADWQIFCSQDSASELQSMFGIGPVSEQNTTLQQTYAQLSSLAAALESYKKDYASYPDPTKTAGLQALTRPRRGSTAAEDAYVAKIPTDPWGNDYIYQTPRLLHGAKKTYALYTLGKNGVDGGTGEDADISNKHLKYLDHINKL